MKLLGFKYMIFIIWMFSTIYQLHPEQTLTYMETFTPKVQVTEITVAKEAIRLISHQPVTEVIILKQKEYSFYHFDEAIKILPDQAAVVFTEDYKLKFLAICKQYCLDPFFMLSVMEKESTFDKDAVNGKCQGLFQISIKWHKDRMEKLGCTDLFDPIENTLVAADFMAELFAHKTDPILVLMTYNMNQQTAKQLYDNGEYSDYALTILDNMKKLQKAYEGP